MISPREPSGHLLHRGHQSPRCPAYPLLGEPSSGCSEGSSPASPAQDNSRTPGPRHPGLSDSGAYKAATNPVHGTR